MNLTHIHRVHCIGIGGIGLSALAQLFFELGKVVSGTDLSSSVVTEALVRRGVTVVTGQQRARNLPERVDLVVYSAAVPPENPELQEARQRGLVVRSYPEALGDVMAGKEAITISGTHGKTTVTALIGLIFTEAAFDPTVVVGSRLGLFDGNFRYGRSRFFIAEACEWRAHFLHYPSRTIVLTNIEEDHLDYFRDLDDILKAFRTYVKKLPADGLLVANADDPRAIEIAASCPTRVVTYGIERGDVRATGMTARPGRQEFVLVSPKERFPITLLVPGRHNVANALAAATVSLEYGIKPQAITAALGKYPGAWRRFEVKGTVNGATVIDDYAHHPTEIRATIEAARQFYPHHRILAAFQPHHRNRTIRLFDGFTSAFDRADQVYLTDIYDVPGRELGEDISSKHLVEAIGRRGKVVEYLPTLGDLTKRLGRAAQPNDVILVMGAGTITNVATELVEKEKSPK